MSEVQQFPFSLNRDGIEALLPHRGDIFVCKSLAIHGTHDYTGIANWPQSNSIIQGHFPGLPIVPGVLLIETMAQLAGAGLLAADPYVQSLPAGMVGVLASVRKCSFSRPVSPGKDVVFEIHCRQMGPLAAQIAAKVSVEGNEVAQLETLMAYAQREQLLQAIVACS